MNTHEQAHEHEDGFTGPALLVTEDQALEVDVVLRGYFQPIQGRYRWHGRVSGEPGTLDVLRGTRSRCVVVTGSGQAVGEVTESDLWGRLAVAGWGTPPFRLDLELPT